MCVYTYKKKTAELLSMKKNQLKSMTGFMIRHAIVKGHLHKMEVYNETYCVDFVRTNHKH